MAFLCLLGARKQTSYKVDSVKHSGTVGSDKAGRKTYMIICRA